MYRVTQPYLNLLVKPRIFSCFHEKYNPMHFERQKCLSKCIKFYFFPEKKICVPTLPKSFRPVTRNILIFFLLDLSKSQISLSICLMVCFLFFSEQIEVGCDVLKKLLTALHPNIILHNFHSELLAGLQHPTSAVKKLCVTQVNLFFPVLL